MHVDIVRVTIVPNGPTGVDTPTTDILVLGATGFTGRLVTRYLFTHPKRTIFTFAIAARSISKLNALIAELNLDDSVKVVQVDVAEFGQVEEAVKRTRVVINVVGPYWRWGTPVVNACVRHGKHYVDLSGETHWIKEMITKFDYFATITGAIIIPSCGFDSMPSDISAFLSNKTLKALAGSEAAIEESMTGIKMGGGISGGTLLTAISTVEEVSADKFRSSMVPYALSPVQGHPVPGPRFYYKIAHSYPPIIGGFFFMSPFNRAVVQRTWGLHQVEARKADSGISIGKVPREHAHRLSYGPNFVYDEFVIASNSFGALLISIGFTFVGLCLIIPPVRWLLKRFGMQSGEGPSEKTMKNGFLEAINVTSSTATPEASPIRVKTVIRGHGDPGYSLTSVMIAEAALSILFSFDELPHLGRQGGVLTPMSALGDVLIERLKDTGKFEFESGLLEG